MTEAVGEVAVLVHDYAGDIDRETVAAARGPTASPADLRAAKTPLDENVVYWFRLARS